MICRYDDGDDIERGVQHDGSQGKSMKEKIQREYFPENFGFEPFGDPFEQKRHHEEEKRRSAPLLPNGEGMPPGSFAQSCHGCSVSTSPSGRVTLTCKQCIAPRGERIESSIEIGICSEEEEITNQEGYLFCATKSSSCNGDLCDPNLQDQASKQDL